jgi:localization factor PodJL
MKPGMPWSVKGIDPETREAAKDAARRSGMTLGEWLNSMILEQGDEADAGQPQAPLQDAPPRMPPSAMKRDDMAVRLEDIATQLAQIARRDQETSPARQTYMPPPAPQPPKSEDGETIRKILNRLDSNEQQTVEAFTAVNERLANLGRQIADTMKSGAAPRAQEPQALKSLEQAVRNIVDHIEVSEKRSRDSLKQVQDKIAEVAHTRPPAGEDAVHASLVADLEAKLAQLSNRVERTERRPAAEPDLLRKELSELAERIESVRVTAEQLATRAQTAAVQTSQRELQEIERRIHSVLKEAQSAFAGQGASQADFQKLRQEVSSLNQRIDATKAGSASDRDVQALRIAFEQLQTRVAATSDQKPLVEMDKRLNDLSRRVDQTQVAAKNIPEISQLERRMAEMDMRLKDAFKGQPDPRQQQAIERKLTEVMDRVGRAEQQLGHVETIERAVNQLFESVDHSRNWARDAAEDAANRMGQRLMAELPRQLQAPNHSAELRVLEDGLRAVRESAVHADQRNQETLEAVHDTLEQIVEKLAELETAAVGHQIAQATLHAAETQSAAPAWAAPPASNPEPLEPAFEASFEPEAKFETEPEAETSSSAAWAAAQQQWQPEPELAAEQPADDYIAAARRAALAAAHSNVLAGAVPASMPEDAKAGKGLFSGLSFKRKRETSAWQATMEERRAPEIRPAAVAPQSNWRRTLFLAGVVLLLGAGAWTLSSVTGKPTKSLSQAEPADAGQVAVAQPGEGEQAVAEATTPLDEITTSALPGPSADSTMQSLVAKPGSLANIPELPPAEIGTQALRNAAQTGDAAAQFIVATRFLDGTGIAGDLTQAAHWYQKSANAGLAPAQYRLATLFERGRGVPKDLATAMVWYTRAAEQGNVKSMHNAAVLAAGTELGAPNYETAQKWFLSASRYGLKDSQFNLAVLYERGLGTEKNPQEALFWYLIAASNKDQDAASRAKLLTKALPKDQVAKVSKRVEAWVPEKSSDSANVVSIQDPAWQDGRALWQQQQPKTEDRLSTMSYMDRLVPQPPLYQPRAADPVLGSTQGLEQVGKAQHLLRQLGYQVGDATGIMDPQTSNAIRLFQFQARQKVTGRASQELIDQLQAQFG